MVPEVRHRRILTVTALVAGALISTGADMPEARRIASTAALPEADSLASMIEFLSMKGGVPGTRYAAREAEMSEIADSLAARLERYTGGQVRRQAFTFGHSIDGFDSTFTGENIIARVPAAGGGSGTILITAHYDAIGLRTAGWDTLWNGGPAPGADDNASGTAAVMEAARILSGLDLPFDLEFVLFSAEELGRLGSIHYVSECGESCADEILGVINADMIGYSGNGTGASVMSDFRSGWLADMMMGFAASADPSLPLDIIKPGPYNWDHASFWEREPEKISAVTLAEPLGEFGSITYPLYHTVEDLPAVVDIELTARIAGLITGFVAGFQEAEPRMSILPSDLFVTTGGAIKNENVFDAGEEMGITARVRNTGGSVPAGGRIELELRLMNSEGERTLLTEDLDPPDVLRSVDISVPFDASRNPGGENRISARIRAMGFDDDIADNYATVTFAVTGTPGGAVIGHSFRPNPIGGAFGEANLCIDLSREADILAEVFTIEGERVGEARLGEGYGRPLPAGLSCHRCSEIFQDQIELSSGIYIYRLTVFERGAVSSNATGRFAVAN